MNHFNELSKEWDRPEKIQQSMSYAEVIKKQIRFSPMNILDVGCGTGLLGQQFITGENSLLGVDTSSGMLEVFDKKFEGNSKVTSLLINLETESLANKFDLILSSMAFHHLKNPQKMVEKLRGNLLPGGVLVVIDLDIEDGSFHSDPTEMGVHHFGFASETTDSWGTGFATTSRQIVNVILKNEGEYNVFLALFTNH